LLAADHTCETRTLGARKQISDLTLARGVQVRPIMKPRAALVSLALHFFGALALFLMASLVSQPPAKPAVQNILIALRAPRKLAAKPGGGGDRSVLPAQRGRAPEVHVRKIFMPPVAVIRNENPKLVVEQALLTTPDFNIAATNVGDPFGVPSGSPGGPGGPSGYGKGRGNYGGDGDGNNGPGVGEGNKPKVRLSRQPQVIYKVEPEYSEDARKVHFQGTVILTIDVDANGVPANIRVVHSLGLGLDERAIQAVAKWRFRPAMSGDHAVTAPAVIEVSFHLL
jgi:protein TonB